MARQKATKPKEGDTTVTPPIDAGSVSKLEFDAFKQEVSDTQNKILDLLEKSMESKKQVVPENPPRPATSSSRARSDNDTIVPPLEAGPDANAYLPAQYQRIFTEVFDLEDGFTARLVFPEIDPKTGVESGGLIFTILVPEKFSNVTPAHKKLYKQDLRTRALQSNNIASGIKAWCEAVARNLKYNKNIKTK